MKGSDGVCSDDWCSLTMLQAALALLVITTTTTIATTHRLLHTQW